MKEIFCNVWHVLLQQILGHCNLQVFVGQHFTSYFGLDEEQLSTVGYPWCNRPDWKPENLLNFHLLSQLWNPTQASHLLEDSSGLNFSWMATQCSLQVFPYCTPRIQAWFFARGKNPPVKWLLQPLSSHWLLQSEMCSLHLLIGRLKDHMFTSDSKC